MKKKFTAVIIGSGFSGMGMAIQLQNAGINDYVILERKDEMGGTWQQNTYPGAAVDVPSHLYSFSFEPYNWSRLYAQQAEILEYTNFVIDKYKLREKCELNTCVNSVVYDEKNSVWTISTESGTTYECQYTMFAIGPLSSPSIPNIKGKDRFKGHSFHSGEWDHDYDYTGKRVAIIGTGASSVQIIPAIAEKTGELYAFQRTPHWVAERKDRILKPWENKLGKIPAVLTSRRYATYWQLESRLIAFKEQPKIMKILEKQSLRYMKKTVKDKSLHAKLTPDYTFGCKRVLLTSKYYPTLNRDNVHLETDGIAEINAKGILTKDGRQIDLDLIVYATGYHIAEKAVSFPIIGRDGMHVSEAWKNGAHAYLGTTVPYMPNFFIIGGPNTGIGHTSFLFLMEAQVHYIIKAIETIKQDNLKTVEVKADVEQEYNDKIQEDLKKTVWVKGGCTSWYQTGDGRNTIIYPNYSFLFWKETRQFDKENYVLT